MANVKYRKVARKAVVGDRILVNNYQRSTHTTNGYQPELSGRTLTVTRVDSDGDVDGVLEVPVIHGFIFHRADSGPEYVVLEPVTTASLAAVPQEPDTIAASFRQFVLDNADAIRAILPALETQLSAEPPVRKAQPKPLSRAEVIAKATADVAELKRIGGSTFADLPKVSPLHGRFYTVEFHVNREKRAVTALVKRGTSLLAKATAKAAPGDVFHAEIGKAIALRRALGLAVPDEYVNAPKPEEKRVGMHVVSEYKTFRLTSPPAFPKNGEAHVGSFHGNNGKVIDDTDVDYGGVIAAGGEGNHSLCPKGAA